MVKNRIVVPNIVWKCWAEEHSPEADSILLQARVIQCQISVSARLNDTQEYKIL